MLSYDFMRNALISGLLVAIICPIIGTFLVLRRFSMMGDTLAHSAFAGVTAGLVLGASPGPAALIYTLLSSLLIEYLRNRYRGYQEVVMSIVMTFNVGLAIFLASTDKVGTNINQFLFGSILTVTYKDILLILLVVAVTLVFLYIYRNQLIYSTFDEDGAKISGINTKALNYMFAAITGATVGVSSRITGILVITSIMVIPIAAAINLGKGFFRSLTMSVIFGLISVILGIVLSYYLDSAPGGTIALTSVTILLITFILRKEKK